jgi:hypothetical protein
MLVLRGPAHLPSCIPLSHLASGCWTTLGRDAESVDVRIADSGRAANVISRLHARLRRTASGAYELHCTATNGVAVNGLRTQQATLADGDEITFAPHPLQKVRLQLPAELRQAGTEPPLLTVLLLVCAAAACSAPCCAQSELVYTFWRSAGGIALLFTRPSHLR